MINFNDYNDEQREVCERHNKAIIELCCELIHSAKSDSLNDIEDNIHDLTLELLKYQKELK